MKIRCCLKTLKVWLSSLACANCQSFSDDLVMGAKLPSYYVGVRYHDQAGVLMVLASRQCLAFFA